MRTCGDIYKTIRGKLDGLKYDQLSLGFLLGQAEKVYIGACDACMTKDVALVDAADIIASEYGLSVTIVSPEVGCTISPELWIHRYGLPFRECEADSPEWHLRRAALCGIPANRIDLYFHKRYK